MDCSLKRKGKRENTKKRIETKKKKERDENHISNVHTFQRMGSFFRIRRSSILDYIYTYQTQALYLRLIHP